MAPAATRAPIPDRAVRDPAYREALAWLYGLSPNVRSAAEVVADHPRKLPRMRALLDRLGNPERAFETVLVAGTKGKGSTAAMLEAILRAAGRATALYTQPHLVSWCERTRVGGRAIEPAEAARLMPRVRAATEAVERERPGLGGVTTFEAGTAVTLLHVAERGAELAVVEVGVGGRYDATNALEPVLSIVAPIGRDHVATLGPTLAEIARHKAGILRPGVPAVVGLQPPEALAEIAAEAHRLGTPLEHVGRDWRWRPSGPDAATGPFEIVGPGGRHYDDLRVPLVGRHQRENAALAVAAAARLSARGHRGVVPPSPAMGEGEEPSTDAVRAGLAAVEWPGRFQTLRERPWVVVDGAHNDDSARRLAEAYRDVFGERRCRLVFGTSAGKDAAGMLDALLPLAGSVVLARARHERAAPLDEVLARVRELAPDAVVAVEPTVAGALGRALSEAGRDDVVLVTGSLFVVGEAIEALA